MLAQGLGEMRPVSNTHIDLYLFSLVMLGGLLNESNVITLQKDATCTIVGIDWIKAALTLTKLSTRFCIFHKHFSCFVDHDIHKFVESLGIERD